MSDLDHLIARELRLAAQSYAEVNLCVTEFNALCEAHDFTGAEAKREEALMQFEAYLDHFSRAHRHLERVKNGKA